MESRSRISKLSMFQSESDEQGQWKRGSNIVTKTNRCSSESTRHRVVFSLPSRNEGHPLAKSRWPQKSTPDLPELPSLHSYYHLLSLLSDLCYYLFVTRFVVKFLLLFWYEIRVHKSESITCILIVWYSTWWSSTFNIVTLLRLLVIPSSVMAVTDGMC